MYSCKQCGSSADVVEGVLKKTCSCDCGVYMDMGNVRLKGIGTVREKNTIQEVLDLLINFIVSRYKELSGKA